ncbi:MAG TPA: hypothetical protein VK436_07190 [Methanocella sp.]|nr:hypothetical protein [Methanocella sp.]
MVEDRIETLELAKEVLKVKINAIDRAMGQLKKLWSEARLELWGVFSLWPWHLLSNCSGCPGTLDLLSGSF